MAETKNWVEKAGKEIDDKYGGILCIVTRKERAKENADIILSHAPVIDAEKIAEKAYDEALIENREEQKQLTQLITDNMTLDIEWDKNGYIGEWGQFWAKVYKVPEAEPNKWFMALYCNSGRVTFGTFKTKKLAQAAVDTELKKILAGVRE